MSPLWRDQIRIVLGPQQVGLIRLARGWRPRIAAKFLAAVRACEPGEAPWRAPLVALERALAEFDGRPADAVVVLSNHFVRYALVAGGDQVSTADEEQALVRHSFERIYGGAVDRWAARLNQADGGDGPQLAGAVDQDLLDALRALFPPANLRLRSIQSCLGAAFNRWHQGLPGSAWFAVVEPGRLCLAELHGDRWHSINTAKIGHDWSCDLAIHLERARLLSASTTDHPGAGVPVFVFAPGCPEPPPQAGPNSLALLRPAPALGDAETADAPYSVALMG